MGDDIIWTLSSDRTKRRAVGRPDFFYDFVPPVGTTYGKLLELWATSVNIPGNTTYGALYEMFATAVDITPPPNPPLTRPTGPGIYAIEDVTAGWETMTGAAGLITACNTVAGLSAAPDGTRHLTLPEHVFSANGFVQSSNYLGFLIPQSVGIIGSGNGTVFEVAKDTMSRSTADTWEKYNAPFGTASNIIYVFLTLNPPPGTVYGQFHVRGTRQFFTGTDGVARDHYYGGWHVQGASNQITINDVKVSGNYGYLNSPPGETFGLNLDRCVNTKLNRVEFDGRLEETGVRVGAAGIGLNNCSGVEIRDCYTHHSYCSHGLALWQTRNITTWNHRSEFNGTSGAANGGISGDGLNNERSFNTIHYSPRVGNNSLCEVRYEGHNDGGSGASYDGDTFPHRIDDLVLTDAPAGGVLNIRMDALQATLPTLNRCPQPVYAYT